MNMRNYQATYGNRSDGWTEKEDKILANIVLRYVENGNTQIQAFEAAGIELQRTAAACGFRWNSQVRKGYEKELKRAKLSRPKPEPLFLEAVKADEPDNTIVTESPFKKIEALTLAGFTVRVCYNEKKNNYRLDIFNPKK